MTQPDDFVNKVICGDCVEVMQEMPENSVDAIVTDPPYGLEFMGKEWDRRVPGVPFWAKALRVAKPGAHLVAFGGTRTFHRLACAIEDAGWEIRDCLGWIYGSGFPKGHKLKGEHEGWGTTLKPAWEPIILARKTLCGTVAENVQRYGTGALNIDGCRVGTTKRVPSSLPNPNNSGKIFNLDRGKNLNQSSHNPNMGRWPANLIHDGSQEVLALFPQSKDGVAVGGHRSPSIIYGKYYGRKCDAPNIGYGGSGSAARFFYCAKASRAEREAGLEGIEEKLYARSGRAQGAEARGDDEYKQDSIGLNRISKVKNRHPCVKPIALMRYLCRLVTPPNGLILDPFFGSGTTGLVALRLGRRFIGIELNPAYCKIAEERLAQGFL